MSITRVFHASTVHPWDDNRIFEKMVRGLDARGWRVTYLARESCAFPRDRYPTVEFVSLGARPGIIGRLERNFRVLRRLLGETPAIFHFHDPELMFVGWALRMRGWRVVYDVHEDMILAIDVKHELPNVIRPLLRVALQWLEAMAARSFAVALAEKAYRRRFPNGTLVLNYPADTEASMPAGITRRRLVPPYRLIYTGTVSEERGAGLFGAILRALPQCEMHVIGRCDEDLLRRVASQTVDVRERLHMQATPQGVAFSTIRAAYESGGWAFGLAVFPRTEHYYEKELTKFFEYMQHGIPILCSAFPVWVSLVERCGSGITVDVGSLEEELHKVAALLESPQRWADMAEACLRNARRFRWEEQLDALQSLYARLRA